MALTHNRVYNNFKSGTEHIKKATGTEFLVRPNKTLPRLMKTSTNAKGETSRVSGRTGFKPAAITRARPWFYLQTARQTRKKAILSGSVGTSAASKRAWKRRARYCRQAAPCNALTTSEVASSVSWPAVPQVSSCTWRHSGELVLNNGETVWSSGSGFFGGLVSSYVLHVAPKPGETNCLQSCPYIANGAVHVNLSELCNPTVNHPRNPNNGLPINIHGAYIRVDADCGFRGAGCRDNYVKEVEGESTIHIFFANDKGLWVIHVENYATLYTAPPYNWVGITPEEEAEPPFHSWELAADAPNPTA